MAKRLATGIVAVFVSLLALGGTSVADGTTVLGPYVVVSPDSGTCRNDWATDTFTRRFHVSANGDGTYTMRVMNTSGSFVTIEGKSPGACEPGSRHGATIGAGVRGKMHGTVVGIVRGGTFDPNASCGDPCYMSTFTRAFFGPAATFDITDFSFTYTSGAQGLGYREWTNALAGNRGDIAQR